MMHYPTKAYSIRMKSKLRKHWPVLSRRDCKQGDKKRLRIAARYGILLESGVTAPVGTWVRKPGWTWGRTRWAEAWHYLRHGSALLARPSPLSPCFNFVGQVSLSLERLYFPPHIPAFLAALAFSARAGTGGKLNKQRVVSFSFSSNPSLSAHHHWL